MCDQCIRYKQEDEYDEAVDDGILFFQSLIEDFYNKKLDSNKLKTKLRDALKYHYLRMMLLSLGSSREPDDHDLEWIDVRLNKQYEFLDNFINDLNSGTISKDRALWRVGLYSYARPVYTRYSISQQAADLMPILPGDDCLGGVLCGCSLDEENYGDELHVYWVLDPLKESCPVCIAHSIESPFIFTIEDMLE